MTRLCLVALLLFCPCARAAERRDILIEDFEGQTYGKWKVTGEAFGKGPARGTLPGQMAVTGYLGKGLVNSFHKGDGSTGTLTSPAFPIERRYINFLVGGGGHAGKTCINLLREGKIVRTATGPNTAPGGSERLDWHTWDVADLAGKAVVIQIVDDHTGGWGHINVDHIVQSDRRKAGPASREIVIQKHYLHLPVRTGAVKRRMRFVVADKVVREFEIELADGDATFGAFADVRPFEGKKLRIEVNALPTDSRGLSGITQGDQAVSGQPYQEKHRPQFHFTSRRGWLNDPNGMVYSEGEYHLYYQHNPYGWDWGNMHWGHAVSKDLVHWKELPIALYPRRFGDWCFSGSAVVDATNTSGFRKGKEDVLVLAYTSTGRGECIACSTDRGRTWSEYAGNPVVRHQGRDPRLLWHGPGKRWVMAVYDEHDRKQWIAFYTSADLKKWTFQSRIEGYFECPDLFEAAIEGGSGTRWVLYAADGQYVLGDFDGKAFRPASKKQQVWYGNFYAAQTFSDAPGGARIQIGWARGSTFPQMPFNQQMTVACRLTLKNADGGVHLYAYPVKEVEKLRGKKMAAVKDALVKPGDNPLEKVKGELFDVLAEVEPDGAAQVGFSLRGVPVVYDVKKQQVRCGSHTAPLKLEKGQVRLRLLVDRGSVELFGNGGRVALSAAGVLVPEKRELEFFSRGGNCRVKALEVFEMRSAWQKKD